ncbi:vesicle transport protein SFT2B-like [Corticium candelabrum]|uniref:vesicle transport protein SFT2B-like n=1 Tax=Corticium candelabrum TaxID=121492 RepID=UPI002E26BA67|nr:vesicle transport protein SFT2B-like [Corticium candelabrum]
MAETFKKMKNYVTGNEEEERGIMEEMKDELNCCKSLSWATRIKGFLICVAIGFVLSMLGTVMIFVGNFVAFGILYSSGTITAICSSFFLMGPWRQVKKMVDPNRLIATIVMIITIILTFLAAFLWKNGGLCILFVILQFLAFTWYCLSYIPFARDCVIKAATSCCG